MEIPQEIKDKIYAKIPNKYKGLEKSLEIFLRPENAMPLEKGEPKYCKSYGCLRLLEDGKDRYMCLGKSKVPCFYLFRMVNDIMGW